MDKQAIFKRVAQVEDQIGELYKELGGLKEQIVELIEENTRLDLENKQLNLLLEKEKQKDQKQTSEEEAHLGEHNHLTQLYDEGFHICNVHYGRLRTKGDCLFCLSFQEKSAGEDQ